MTTQANPGAYSRVYWRFIDEYPDVFDDDRAFATWLRLLILAEGAHPQPAPLPGTVRKSVLTKLIDEGLVTLLPGGRYRVKGLAQERERRAEQGRKGANARWSQSEGNAKAMPAQSERIATAMPAEQSKDEQSKDETRITARASGPEKIGNILPDAVDVGSTIPVEVGRLQKLAEELTQQPYVMANVHSSYGLKAVTEQLPHGFDRVERAWRKIAAQITAGGTSRATLRQLVLGADDLLNPIPRQDATGARADDEKAAFERRVARTRDYLGELRAAQREP